MAVHRFEAELRPTGRGGGHFVEVPDEVVRALGGKGRTPVKATFNGVPYRGSIVRMGGGVWRLGVLKAIMAEAVVGPGDVLDVVVEADEGRRDVDVPGDLRRALAKRKGLKAAFDSMSFTHRREYLTWIEEAKKPETRGRRIAKTVEAMTERVQATPRD